MNEVDTSPETINAEFDAAAEAIGVEPESPTPTPEQIAAEQEVDQQAQIAIAKEMIGTTLRLSIGMFANVSVDNQHTDEAAQAYAVLIIKYFPGGIFGLLDKYKEELTAATATVMLIKAINEQKAQAKAKQLEEEQKAEAAKKPTPSATGAFTFGEEPAGEHANG